MDELNLPPEPDGLITPNPASCTRGELMMGIENGQITNSYLACTWRSCLSILESGPVDI